MMTTLYADLFNKIYSEGVYWNFSMATLYLILPSIRVPYMRHILYSRMSHLEPVNLGTNSIGKNHHHYYRGRPT